MSNWMSGISLDKIPEFKPVPMNAESKLFPPYQIPQNFQPFPPSVMIQLPPNMDKNQFLDNIFMQLNVSPAEILEYTINGGDLDRTKYLLKKTPVKWKDHDGKEFWIWNIFSGNTNTESKKICKLLAWETAGGYKHYDFELTHNLFNNRYGKHISENILEWIKKNPASKVANFANRTDITSDILELLPNLKALNISGCQNINNEYFKYLKNLQNLHSLNISGSQNISNNTMQYLEGIHTLNISNCKKITDNAFVYFRGINTLDISDNDKITDNALVYLKGINHLYMRNCPLITDQGLQYLKGVKTLDISGCNPDRITDAGLYSIKGVMNLTISYNHKFSPEIIKELNSVSSLGIMIFYA